MIKKIVFALLLGLCSAIIYLQDDPWIKEALGAHCRSVIGKAGNCIVTGTVGEVNLFTPSITFNNLSVTESDHTWQWTAGHVKVGCSWLHLLCFGSIDISIEVRDYDAYTAVENGSVALMRHINTLMSAPPGVIPTFVKSIQFRNAQLTLVDPAQNITGSIQWNSDSKKIEQIFKSNIYLVNGSVAQKDNNLVNALHGTFFVDSFVSDTHFDLFIRMNTSFDLSQLPDHEKTCFVTAVWDHDHGFCTIKNSNQLLVVDPITFCLSEKGIALKAQVETPLKYVGLLANGSSTDSMISGSVLANFETLFSLQTITYARGSVLIKDPSYSALKIGQQATFSFNKKQQEWQGLCSLMNEAWHLNGSWDWHEFTKKGSIKIANTSALPLPYAAGWFVQPEKASMELAFDKKAHHLKADYSFDAHYKDDVLKSTGSALITKNALMIEGMLNERRYSLKAENKPIFSVCECHYLDADGQPLFTLKRAADDQQTLTGSITMPLMRYISRSGFGYEMQGEGSFDVRVTLGDTINAAIHLANGTVRLPRTYNFINGIDATIDLDIDRQKVTVTDLHCTMHKGLLTCARASFLFNEDGALAFAHAPLLLKSCLFNFDKDLFTMVSGRILFMKKEDEKPLVKSRLIVEHAQLKENLFSEAFQKNVFKITNDMMYTNGSDIQCDIKVDTRSPIYIKTPFLETYATINLMLNESVNNPAVSGAINFKSGMLNFPYKPLYITKGVLYFVPQQPSDPIIELVAKNKIKKYNIVMRINGSISEPHIILESAPPLTEEQIIALMLVGSEEESLNIVMPALIMQNITALLFGRESSSLNLARYFKTLLKPFKNVHLVPSFTDQSGRGGLRGALEVEVNERWRALIQKNFSLSEDTRFELEYLVSDDVSLRAIRDERRDVGGEVEMRWKF